MTARVPPLRFRDFDLRAPKLVVAAVLAIATFSAVGLAAAGAPTKTHPLRHGWIFSHLGISPRAMRSNRTRVRRRSSYDWPIKPFHHSHPVRGDFNDPRVAPGVSYSFHFGIDIDIPKFHTAVYAIRAGRVHMRNRWAVAIVSGKQRLEYWHIVPVVHEGQWVPRHAFLGKTKKIFNHVHLSEFVGGRLVNPLRPGGIGPSEDTTAPTTDRLRFRQTGGGIVSGDVHGIVDVVADSYDTVPEIEPKQWPVTSALLRWRIRLDGQVVVGWQIAHDFRSQLKAKSRFGQMYAPGTDMNRPGRAGHYCFYLAHGWDSASLPNGSYVLEVAASDVQGNSGFSLFDFTIAN